MNVEDARKSAIASGLRSQFPILDLQVGSKPLVYLDNAATTQKPQCVLDSLQRFYMLQNANIHRGVHYLSERATTAYEEARETLARFVNASSPSEIVFTRGATESINLIAHSFLRPRLRAGDEVLITHMEHHANIVPWQLACESAGARLRALPVLDSGELDGAAVDEHLTERTRLFAFTHVSNALGTVNPAKDLIAAARRKQIPVVLDAAQSVAHLPVDVQELGCDFLVASGHKMFGPTGIGFLFGTSRLLEQMPPYQGGGDMIERVTLERTTFKMPPGRFEAGTPHIAGAIALGTAARFLMDLDRAALEAQEAALLDHAVERLLEIPEVTLIGCPAHRTGAISFTLKGVHPHDIATILDSEGVAIRAGHHCAQPLMQRFGVPATARASFALYNDRRDVSALIEGLRKVLRMFC